MKKMFFISVGMMMLAVTGCNQNKTKEGAVNTEQNDSIQQILSQKIAKLTR